MTNLHLQFDDSLLRMLSDTTNFFGFGQMNDQAWMFAIWSLILCLMLLFVSVFSANEGTIVARIGQLIYGKPVRHMFCRFHYKVKPVPGSNVVFIPQQASFVGYLRSIDLSRVSFIADQPLQKGSTISFALNELPGFEAKQPVIVEAHVTSSGVDRGAKPSYYIDADLMTHNRHSYSKPLRLYLQTIEAQERLHASI